MFHVGARSQLLGRLPPKCDLPGADSAEPNVQITHLMNHTRVVSGSLRFPNLILDKVHSS